jgi:hypothetical protein
LFWSTCNVLCSSLKVRNYTSQPYQKWKKFVTYSVFESKWVGNNFGRNNYNFPDLFFPKFHHQNNFNLLWLLSDAPTLLNYKIKPSNCLLTKSRGFLDCCSVWCGGLTNVSEDRTASIFGVEVLGESESLHNWRLALQSVSQTVTTAFAWNPFWNSWPNFKSVVRLLRLSNRSLLDSDAV